MKLTTVAWIHVAWQGTAGVNSALHENHSTSHKMSELATPTPTRASDGSAADSGAAHEAVPAVAELAGERASPPPATFTAVINIKCPDQTGVVRGSSTRGVNVLMKRGDRNPPFTDGMSDETFTRLIMSRPVCPPGMLQEEAKRRPAAENTGLQQLGTYTCVAASLSLQKPFPCFFHLCVLFPGNL